MQDLVSALEGQPPTPNRSDLYDRVASQVGRETIGPSELKAMLDALISLFALRDGMEMNTPEFVGAIADAMEQSGIDSLEFFEVEHRETFEARLTQFLEIDSLEVAAKAISLSYEQEHTLHGNPRILTDVRPIFSSEPEDVYLRGAMVMHTLKFEYHEGREIKEMFIALDSEEVEELIGALERAKSKAESLKQWIQESPVDYIEAE